MKLSSHRWIFLRAKPLWNSQFPIHGTFRWHSHARWYSSSTRAIIENGKENEDFKTFDVTCGAAGTIEVDLYNSDLLSKPTTPLFIYLPPTGCHLRESHPSIPSFLLSPSAAIARINYRWNHLSSSPRHVSTDADEPSSSPSTPNLLTSDPGYANHPFPTPLHDTLHAFSFLTDSLLPSYSPDSAKPKTNGTSTRKSVWATPPPTPSKTLQRPIIIYGSYLGGTLAASLGLTESQISKTLSYQISGVISKNGIFDWTEFGSTPPPEGEAPSQAEDFESWDMKKLHRIKKHLFSDPAGTFDNFVSPALFFRTAGTNVPPKWPSNEEDPTENEYSELMFDDDMFLSSPVLNNTSIQSALTKPTPPPRGRARKTTVDLSPAARKSHLKFPPPRSGLKIPRSLFLVAPPAPAPKGLKSKASKVRAKKEKITPLTQAKELGGLMRRSISQLEFKDRKMWDEDLDDEAEGMKRVGVWECGDGIKEEEVGEWIEECLDS
ncbi:hypothetical protein HYFRA_00012166 [Hymenoscyphus fraxineus]|uniref:Uncharacterized protein n=1 Tax=Hymenoscyphus fraxineus TaxID=746836 RepID=A0A9N9L8P6_9HELO|nr:hypothetical protein HYFRA_00012166 [Hymenoscyphus fraxineus]